MAAQLNTFKEFCNNQPTPETHEAALKLVESIQNEIDNTKFQILIEINARDAGDSPPERSLLVLKTQEVRQEIRPDDRNFGCARSGYIHQREPRPEPAEAPIMESLSQHWRTSTDERFALTARIIELDEEIERLQSNLLFIKRQI